MRHPMITARLSVVAVAAISGAVATTALVPDANAQGKGGAAAKGPDKKTKDAAHKAYSAGEKAFNAGNYDKAYENFKQANELIPSPHAQYWMALSLSNQNKDDEAIRAFESLLSGPDVDKLGEEKQADAKKKLEELKAKGGGELVLTVTPPNAAVAVDGEPKQGGSPVTLKLTSGKHKIKLSAEGFEAKEIDVDVKSGDKLDQTVKLTEASTIPVEAAPPMKPGATPPPVETPPGPAEPPPEKKSKVPAYVTLGIAGAGAIVGTVFGIKALSAKSDFDKNPTSDNADTVERNALIADMSFGVAITLGVTGIVLLVSASNDEKETPSTKQSRYRGLERKSAGLTFAPYATPKGGGAAARFTF